jgi:hypothetical protein
MNHFNDFQAQISYAVAVILLTTIGMFAVSKLTNIF